MFRDRDHRAHLDLHHLHHLGQEFHTEIRPSLSDGKIAFNKDYDDNKLLELGGYVYSDGESVSQSCTGLTRAGD